MSSSTQPKHLTPGRPIGLFTSNMKRNAFSSTVLNPSLFDTNQPLHTPPLAPNFSEVIFAILLEPQLVLLLIRFNSKLQLSPYSSGGLSPLILNLGTR